MKFKLRKLKQFCGVESSFYTVVDDEGSLFGKFLDENVKKNEPELLNIIGRIKSMGNTNAATENFFKLDESSDPADEKIVAFYDRPEARLRLYCIRFSDKLTILGGGGPKPKGIIRRWQDSKKLTKEVETVMLISKLIDAKLKSGDLGISNDGLSFTGTLELN